MKAFLRRFRLRQRIASLRAAFLRRFRLRQRTASLRTTLPSLQPKQQQMKKHRLSLLFVVSLFAAVLLDFISLPSSAATTTLSFSNAPTLVSGAALTAGAVYRFPGVVAGDDALVQITTMQNAQLKVLDDNTTFPARFQPTIAPSSASLTNSQSYVRFDFKLTPSSTPAGTSFAAAPTATVTNVYFSAQDVDGNGAANTIREFVEVIGATTSYIANPTLLQPMGTLPVVGGVGYEQKDSLNIQPGIGTGDQYEIYSYLGTSVSTFSIVGGNITGSAGCVLNNVGCDRQNSWTFDVADVQKLDFGDAPASYGDAYHPVPPAPTVYLGTSVDGDDAPFHTVNADGDDTNGTDDENGVASFPALSTTSTSYSLNLTCAGGGTVAGWIDFNRNGVFDAAERTSGTCSGTTVTLNWAGLSGLSAGATYARFRTASVAAEVANPTGQASNGEVEDYALPITTTLSGTVFDDADGSKLQNGTEVGTNAGGLNAVLIDSTNKVIATTAIAANGTYTFNNVPASATYTVEVTTATATVGSAPPAVTLPSNWVSTGENLNGTADGTVDGILSVTVTTTNVTGANLGIEQRPTAVGGTATSQTNPGGTTTVTVASTLFTGSTDPDGTVAAYKITAFPSNTTSITINGTNYTSGSFPGAGVTVTTAQLAGMVVDPIDGAVTVGIPFQAIDNAGQLSSNTATASLPFSAAPAVCTKASADGSYATSGTNKNSIWWLNFECYDETIASTATGQPFTFTLPDGSTMTLNVKKTGANPLKTITSPSWGLAAFGNSGQYGGVTGKPIFYNSASTSSQDWKETLTSITVTDKLGNVRSYSFVTADGETTNPTTDGFGRTANEQLNFATNGTGWTQVELLNMPGQSGPLGTTLTGAGSSNASWTGTTGSNNGGVILSTNNPTQVSIASTLAGTAGSYTSLQGGLFGIGMPKLTLIKNINGRIAAADQFTTEIAYTAPAVSLKTATSSGAATTFSTGAIAVLPGNVINLRETMAAGSSSPLTAYNASIACTNVNPTATVLPSGTGTSFNITPRIGDDITCTITNTFTHPNVLLVKRITAINGDRTKNPNDNTPLNAFVDDTTSTRQADDNSPNWKAGYLLGAIDAGKVKPGDEIEYTIYFLNAGGTNANTVRICDRLSGSQDFKFNSYGASADLQLQLGTSSVLDLTSANDAADRAQLISAGGAVPANCYLKAVNDNGTLMLDVTGTTGVPALTTMPGSTAPGTPNNSYGFFRFVTKVKP